MCTSKTCLVVCVVLASVSLFFYLLAFAPLYECSGDACKSPYDPVNQKNDQWTAMFSFHVLATIFGIVTTILVGVALGTGMKENRCYLITCVVLISVQALLGLIATALLCDVYDKAPFKETYDGFLAAMWLALGFNFAAMGCAIAALCTM